MNFVSMQTAACAKVSKSDTNALARCLEFIKARDKMIYESFDWKASQIIVDKTILASALPVTTLTMPEIHHAISVRLDGKLLDPVSASYVFESATQTSDPYLTAGTPLFYDETLDLTAGTRSLRFFPPLANDGVNHALSVLGKAPYNDAWTGPAIPATESALLAFVIADMWEYLHAVGKSQAKLQEAVQIYEKAKEQDMPALRPRQSKIITPSGNSLAEMTDAVCYLIGDFSPVTRNSVKACIRRNHRDLWNSALWPESTAVGTVTALNSIAIIPHLIDKIISVRMNVNLANNNYKMLAYANSSLLLGLTPEVFNQTGEPINYNIIMPSALPVALSPASQLKLSMTGVETAVVFLKGEVADTEQFETLTITNADTTTASSYDTMLTISKPQTKYMMTVKDTGGNTLMQMMPGEQSRKYQRIQLFPQFDPTADQTLFVLGKRRVPQLMDDGDTVELTGAENVLVYGATADILLAKIESSADAGADAFLKSGGMARIQAFQQKAQAALQTLLAREMTQQTFSSRILPYVEGLAGRATITKDNILGI